MEIHWSCVGILEHNSTNETLIIHICPQILAACVLLGFLSLFTVFGNIFVLVAIFTNDKLKKRVTSVLICNLALADLLVGSVVMPLALVTTVTNGQWLFSRMMCRIWISLDVISCTASIVTLCVISLDRFLGVTTPIQYATRITRSKLKLCAVAVWVFSVLVLLATIRWELQPHADESVCDVAEELRYVTHSVMASFFIPLIIILCVYFKIYQVTKRRERGLLHSLFEVQSSKKIPDPGSNQRKQSTLATMNGVVTRKSQNKYKQGIVFLPLRMHYGGGESQIEKQRRFYLKHKKSAKTLGIVVGSFFLCWFPFFALYLTDHFCGGCIPAGAMHFFTWLGYANSSFNPIIYSISMRSFRGTFEIMIKRLFCSTFWGSFCSPSLPKNSYRRTRNAVRRSLKYLKISKGTTVSTTNQTQSETDGESSVSLGSCHALDDDDARSSTSAGIQNLITEPDPKSECKNLNVRDERRNSRKYSTTLIISNPDALCDNSGNKLIKLTEFLSLSTSNSPKRVPMKFRQQQNFKKEIPKQETVSPTILKTATSPVSTISTNFSPTFMNLKLYSILVSNKVTEV